MALKGPRASHGAQGALRNRWSLKGAHGGEKGGFEASHGT